MKKGGIPRSRRARWKRRILLAAGVLVGLRLLLALAVPPLLRSALASRGLAARWERLDLSLLGGEVELWGLALAPKRNEGAAAAGDALSLSFLRGDLSVPALLTGNLRVRHAEIQSLELALVREHDGSWRTEPPIDLGALAGSGSEEEPPAEDAEAEAGEPASGWPLRADLVTAGNLVVLVRDEAADPPVEHRLEVSATLRDLGAPDRPARLALRAIAPGSLDLLRVDAAVRGEGPARMVVEAEAELAGLDLARLPIDPASLPFDGPPPRVDARLRIEVEREPTGEGERLRAALDSLSLRLDGEEVLAAPAAEVALERSARGWRPERLEARDLVARLERVLGADGAVRAVRVGRLALEPAGERRRFVLRLSAEGVVSSLDVAGDFDWDVEPDGTLAADLVVSPLAVVLEGGPSVRLGRLAAAGRTGPAAVLERLAWNGLEVSDPVEGKVVAADGEVGPISFGEVAPETRLRLAIARPDGITATIEGTAKLAAQAQAADLRVAIGGLPPLRAEEPEPATASFDLSFERRAEAGGGSARARIERLRWSEGGGEPLGIGAIALAVSPLDPGGERVVVQTFSVEDLTWRPPGAGGLQVSVDLSTDGPLVLLDPEIEAAAPWSIRAEVRARPLLEHLALSLRAEPFAPEMRVEVDARAEGLEGSALAQAFPAFAEALDAAALDGGSAGARLSLSARPQRRGPWALDLGAGFPARIVLEDLALRDSADRTLAGVDRVEVSASRIQPGGKSEIGAVEIETPRLTVEREPGGWRVAGILFRAPVEAAAAEAGAPVETDAAPAGPGWSLASLEAHGLDLRFADRTVEPVLEAPLVDLDLTARDLGVPGRPLRFQVYLRGGEVELPARERADSAVAGVLGAVAGAIAGSGETPRTEPRPLFEELVASGQMGLEAPPTGQVHLSLRGMELPAIAGPAAASGLTIGDGVLDLQVRVRALGAEGSRVDGEISLTDLSLSEGSDGPISRVLQLPAPLDTVIFVLRDDQDRIRLSPSFAVAAGGFRTGEALSAASTALGQLIARAVAAAPVRVASTLTDLAGVGKVGEALGLDGLFSSDAPGTIVFGFRPGTIGEERGAPPPAEGARASLGPDEVVEAIIERLRSRWTDGIPLLGGRHEGNLVLEHRFGTEDLARADVLGTPDAGDALDLAARLRLERAQWLRRRGEIAAEARVLLVLGARAEAESQVARMREVDGRIEELRGAIDGALELGERSAERRRAARTRTAALAIARARLLLVRDALRRAAGGRVADLDARLVVRNPRLEDRAESGGGEVRVTYRAAQ